MNFRGPYAEYDARLASAPTDVPALTGAGFAHWWFFDYPGAIRILDDLLAIRPDDVFGNLFRGSSRVLKGASRAAGAADLEYAITLASDSPDLHHIVADAYTYGFLADPARAFDEASIALAGGLNTPRVHAILGAAYNAFGNTQQAAFEIKTHGCIRVGPIGQRHLPDPRHVVRGGQRRCAGGAPRLR